MAIGDIITAARYNNLQSRVATVMGVGSGDDGYGQNLASSQVATNAVVLATDMQTLFTDLANGRIHQTGTQPTEVAFINVSDVILDSDTINKKGVVQFENLTTSLENDKFVIAPSQASAEPGIQAQYTQNWNGTLTHVFDIVFADSDHRRHFFNAGGEIRFTADLDPAASNGKNNDWNNLLAAMGTVKFKSNNCTSDGSAPGTSFNIGNFELTDSYQLVFQKDGTGVYAENDYNISAKENSTTVLEFRIQFRDDDAGDDTNDANQDGAINPIDEDVTGTLDSVVGERLPTGTRVSLTSPTFATTNTL